MIENRLIVCLANSWDYDPTSKHHVMRILSRRNKVLWVNYHGTRRPGLSGPDVRAACAALARWARGPQDAAPSIVQTTPLVLPGATRPLLRWLHERMVRTQIRGAVRALDPRGRLPIQVWSFAPDVPFLCGGLNEECFVYYCVDEYREFSDMNAAGIAAAEDELLTRADLVVTTSQALNQTKQRYRPDAVLIPHGVDYDHFARAWRRPPPRPEDLAEIPRPIFGFFGLIRHWIDVQLIAEVASLRPHYSFVLIGECHSDVTALRKLYNVELLGRRPYETLPAYCAAFDAALLPFVRNSMTRNINPIKMYEYLAAGLPVVSTSLPEARPFEGPIVFADTAEDFARACDRVLETHHAETRPSVSAVVENETWASRVADLSAIVTRCAERKALRGAPVKARVGSVPVSPALCASGDVLTAKTCRLPAATAAITMPPRCC